MLYIVVVKETETEFNCYEYEYGNLFHAVEHFDMEKSCELFKYENGKLNLLKKKGCC